MTFAGLLWLQIKRENFDCDASKKFKVRDIKHAM